MADCFFRRINRDADREKIIEYLDYLAEKLGDDFENIEYENLSDDLKKQIGGRR